MQLRPTRYWATADSHGDGKFTRRVGSRTNGLRRRHLLCFLHRFHKRSRVRAPAKSLLRFRRRDVVPNRRRNLYLRYYSAAFASFRAPIPTSPLSASRLPTPRLWGTIRVYSVPHVQRLGPGQSGRRSKELASPAACLPQPGIGKAATAHSL